MLIELVMGMGDLESARKQTATAAAKFADRPAYSPSLQDGGVRPAFFFAASGSRALEWSPQNAAAGEMRDRVQTVLTLSSSGLRLV